MNKPSSEVITGEHAAHYDRKKLIWQYIRRKHLSYIDPQPGQKILDVGCGTGGTLQELATRYPEVGLFGVEPSEDMIAQAQAKAPGDAIQLSIATAEQLPFTDAYFDYVLTTLVMHHLPLETKQAAAAEMHRVLKPGGVVVLTDWGKPTNLLGRSIGWLTREHAYIGENFQGILVGLMENAGFSKVQTRAVQAGVIHHITAERS